MISKLVVLFLGVFVSLNSCAQQINLFVAVNKKPLSGTGKVYIIKADSFNHCLYNAKFNSILKCHEIQLTDHQKFGVIVINNSSIYVANGIFPDLDTGYISNNSYIDFVTKNDSVYFHSDGGRMYSIYGKYSMMELYSEFFDVIFSSLKLSDISNIITKGKKKRIKAKVKSK